MHGYHKLTSEKTRIVKLSKLTKMKTFGSDSEQNEFLKDQFAICLTVFTFSKIFQVIRHLSFNI